MAVGQRASPAAAVPVLVSAAAFGVTTQLWTPVLWLASLSIGAWLLGARASLGRGAELLLMSSSVIVGSAVACVAEAGEAAPVTGLTGVPARFALSMLVLAVVRTYLTSPIGGSAATTGIALVALTVCGLTHAGPEYAGLVAAFFASAVIALRRDDPMHARWWSWDTRRKAASAATAVAAVIVGVGIAAGGPTLHDRLARIVAGLESARALTSFAEHIHLGRSSDITPSDRLVLRVRGAPVDYLRGTAYRVYEEGEWVAGAEDSRVVTIGSSQEGSLVEIRAAQAAARYFVPMDAREVATPDGRVIATSTGCLLSPSGVSAGLVWFRIGPRDTAPVSPPDETDLQVPAAERVELAHVAGSVIAGEDTVAGRLEAIEHWLRTDFHYSLRHSRPPDRDPTLDFLTASRSGHCEYFASAMALLARSIGIPARVIGGYRVTEYNDLGDYWVVREKNAHAWVEAWIPGAGWRTFDPTPGESIASSTPSRSHALEAVTDLVTSGWLWGWSPRARSKHFAAALGLVTAAGVVRWLAVLWSRRRDARRTASCTGAHAAFEELCRALEALGERRAQSETVEQYARRIAGSPRLREDVRQEAAEILQSHARLRYGREGSAEQVEREVARWLEIARRRPM
ncbi:MAG TPA: transglutaminaseTgpA domain-containing protein [Polyangiaceae bacterium]|nr:transglutaminaseTgpA domain-containing protein [Polyangiaceae bacterium]